MPQKRIYDSSYIGKVYNRLQIVDVVILNNRWTFNCLCICGKTKMISPTDVVKGKTKSCGCYNIEEAKKRNVTHRKSKTRIYRTYNDMKRRCTDTKIIQYKNYGGRGIRCEWETFEEFYADMFSGYSEKLEIERIDVNGNYCKENCKWILGSEQAQNTRKNIIPGGLAKLCRIRGLKYSTVISRIYRGVSIKDACK